MKTKQPLEKGLPKGQTLPKILFFLFFFFIGLQQVKAQRAMYVSLFPSASAGETWPQLLSTTATSNTLTPQAQAALQYAKDNHVTYLILYGMSNLGNSNFRYNLNVFINIAKTQYCITKVGANITCGNHIGFPVDPTNVDLITPYNTSYPNKIDALVAEFEFWQLDPTKSAYIRNQCSDCTADPYANVFYDYFIPLLNRMNEMKNTPNLGITSVDVYLNGESGAPSNQIFSNTKINSDAVFSQNQTEWNVNMVDNRADNVFITAYRNSRGSTVGSSTYLQLRSDYEAYENRSKELIKLFGNTNTGMAGNLDNSTIFKPQTKIYPLFHAGTSSYSINNGVISNFDIGYAGDYFNNDPNLMNNTYNAINYDANPLLSSSFTPQDIEQMFYEDYQANTSYLVNPSTNLLLDNVLAKGAAVWYKYQFLSPTISLPLYLANNILFNSNPTINCNTATFDYSGPNEDGINYTWNFGDGSAPITGTTSATNQLVSNNAGVHTFPHSGPYPVSLTLQYASGCSYTYSQQVQISVLLSVNAGNDQTICGTSTVTLAGTQGGATTSATWSGGTGTYSPNANTLNAVYTPSTIEVSTGSVTLTLTSNDPAGPCGAVSDQVVISLSTPPTATITTNTSTTFCAGGNVILNANTGSGFSYVWKKNGTIIPGQTNSNYTASTAGSYRVVVTIGNGCSTESAVKVVTVNANPVIPTINESGPLTFCAGGSVTLTSSSLGNNLWSTAQTSQSINVTSNGNYFVTVSNANGCSSTSAPIQVTVNPNVTSIFSQIDPICAGETFSLPAISTNNISGTWSPALNNTATTTYTFTPTNGVCATSPTMMITVNSNPTTPSITAYGPLTFCDGSDVLLSSSSTSGNVWTNMQTSQLISASIAGNYAVTVTNANGCSTTSSAMQVTVNPNVTPTFNQIDPICAGETFSLPAISTNNISGTWSPTLNNTVTTTYYFQASAGQCVTTPMQQLTVTVNPLPVIILSSTAATACSTNTFNDGSASVAVSGTDTYSYLWNDNQNQTTANATELAAGDYTVNVTNSANCMAVGNINVASTTALSYPNGHVVTGSETWESDEPIRLKGIIIVNGTLTIQNSTVMFGYDVIDNNDEEEPLAARFQVNDGGQLNIINSTLTGWCDEFWDGIETRGITNTANVFLNNATVQNAKIGFTNDRRRNYLKNYVQGGYIVAENSQFLNNRLAVEIKNDASLCRFTKCEFKCNEATLFSYPAPIVCCEWEPTEMTFVHLRKGEGTLFEGNTFSVNTAVYNVLSRGTGIYSEGAKYELRPHSDNTVNLFEGLTSGIKKVNYSYGEGQMICRGSEFDNIQKGIYIQGGNSDIINNNSFVNIPDADEGGNIEASFHSYGIYINAGGSFDISSNNFSGFASTSPSAHGSHGIAFSNTGASGGLCFDNSFSGVDYGVHTQSNNLNLKIRCNAFSADGNDHNASALYVANGALRNQGNASCANDAAEAAGNTWLGPNATLGKSIESYATLPFDYFANLENEFGFSIPYPNNKSGNVLINPGLNLSNVLVENFIECINSNSTVSCNDPLLGIAPNIQSGWFTSVYIKIGDLKSKLEELKIQFNYLKSLEQGIYEDDLSRIAKDIEWLMNEIQLLENQLYKAYQLYELNDELLDLLTNSKSAESTKILSELYLKNQDYTTCRNTIDSIMPITKREINYLNPESAEIRLRENETFVKYMYTNLDMAEAEKTIMTADQKYIDSLQEVVDANMKISVRAGQELGQRTNVYYEYPIVKNFGGEKSMKIKNTTPEKEKIQFEVFPIPTNGLLTVNYIIPENALNAKIELFDLTGKLIKIYSDLVLGENTLQIDLSNFENGLYTCVYKIDGKQISSKKITVIK